MTDIVIEDNRFALKNPKINEGIKLVPRWNIHSEEVTETTYDPTSINDKGDMLKTSVLTRYTKISSIKLLPDGVLDSNEHFAGAEN